MSDLLGRNSSPIVTVLIPTTLTRPLTRPLPTPLATHLLVDAPLVVGAALFGIGWGLMGACPAPAITNLASATAFPRTLIYLVCLVGGMYLNVGLQYIRDREPAKVSND